MSDIDHIDLRSQRRQQILAFISHHGYASNRELCQQFFISEPTIRRELAILEQEGLILHLPNISMVLPLKFIPLPLPICRKGKEMSLL